MWRDATDFRWGIRTGTENSSVPGTRIRRMWRSWSVVRFEFQLAMHEEDAQLRAILAATPMPGRIAVSFRREPSFFDAAVVDGAFHQVVICRDRQEGRIVGFGCRSVRDRFVNG